jgi:hypothetical protein
MEPQFAITGLETLNDLVERIEKLFSDNRLAAVRILSPKPGDVIVLEMSDSVAYKSKDVCDRIVAQAKEVFGPEVKIAVLDSSLKVAVVRGDAW